MNDVQLPQEIVELLQDIARSLRTIAGRETHSGPAPFSTAPTLRVFAQAERRKPREIR